MNKAKVPLNIIISFLLLAVFLINNGEQQNLPLQGVEVRLERIICVCNPEYFRLTVCKIKFISKDRANMNVIGTMIRNLTGLTYHIKAYYKFSNNEYRPILIDLTTDFCAAQAGLSSTMHLFLTNIWKNYTNIFHPCPILSGEYYLKDWNFATHHLPNLVPAGRYLINSTVRDEFNKVFVRTSVYFYVANHGVLDLGMG